MKNFNDIMTALTACKSYLLQVASYTNAMGEQECVIIFDTDPEDLMNKMKDLRRFVIRRRLPMPLVVNCEFTLSALDSFPIEFLNISTQYQNLFCKQDILAEFKYDKHDMRLQVERELKSKWLLTRMAIIDMPAGSRRLSRLLRMSVSSIFPALKGISYLAGKGVPSALPEIIQNASQITGVDLGIISQLSQSKQSNQEEVNLYLSTLHQLDLALDKISL